MLDATVRAVDARVRAWRHVLLNRVRGETLMLALAAVVGFGTGLMAAALIKTIQFVQSVAFFGDSIGVLHLLLVPMVGAFLVGLVITYLVPEGYGSGIVQVMQAVALRGGRFGTRVPPGGLLTSSLAIGTGASGGREGPIVLIGGSIGSLAGRLFAVGEDRMRSLVAAGAAGGIAASFSAPIGGMLFAIEVIIGGLRLRSIQIVVVSSVVASATTQQLLGSEVIYKPVTNYALGDPRELGLYAVLGLAAVIAGVGLIRLEHHTREVAARLRLWQPAQLAVGGLAVGLLAIGLPEILGTGSDLPPIDGVRDPIQAMIDGSALFGSGVGVGAALALLGLAVAKMLATSISIGTGNSVGTFAPALFIGAALGGSIGNLAVALLPDGTAVEPGAFALVGMAAVFSAAARAPLAAIVLVFEITGDYDLILPLMLAVGLATFVADRIHPESVYTLPLREEGIVYADPEDIDIMQTVNVGEVMTTAPDTVDADWSLEQLREEFDRTGHHGCPVLSDGRLVGVVTLSDLSRADRLGEDGTVRDICTRQPVTVTPEDPVFRGLRRMAALDVGRLPVVSSEDHGELVGLLRRTDIVKAYQRAVTRSVGVQQRDDRAHLRDLAGVQFVELVVEPSAPVANQLVRDIGWPHRTILTSIRRNGEVITPHGDTRLEPGDEVVLLTGSDDTAEVRRLISVTGSDGTTSAGASS